MKPQKFSFIKRLQSFKFAFNGLLILLKEEHNARIHLFATIAVIALGFFINASTFEWIALIFACGLVITTETINSSIENIVDFVSPNKNEQIKKIKDLSAAAVLISTVTAILIGLLVFIPKLL